MFLPKHKQRYIQSLFVQFAEGHISKAYEYDVNFSENHGNAQISFIVKREGKRDVKITNIMTKRGYKSLEERKGWTAWAVEHAELLKFAIIREDTKKPKASIIKKLIQFFKHD